MAQETVNSRLIKSNIDLLTRAVKKPNFVTEKLLSRPPFKFLHDLVTLLVKTSGYLRGLFTDEEFSYEQVNNKDSKIAFLDKLIDAVGFINNKAIDVKATKIVAGVEVEKTNKLLNELAKAVLDKKPFLDAVEKVRKGQKPVETPAASTSGPPARAGAPATKKTAAAPAAKPGNSKAAPAARSKAQPAAKAAAPGKAAATKAAPTKAAATKKEPEKPQKAPSPEPEPEPKVDSQESDKSLESQATKSLEPESIEPPISEELPPPEDPIDKLLGETSLEPDRVSEPPKLISKQNSVELPPKVEPIGNAVDQGVNLENNLDQLVAGLGLDDDEEEEERPEEESRDDNSIHPEDSGIESKSNSFSHSTRSASPQSIQPVIPEISKVDIEEQQPAALAIAEDEPAKSRIDAPSSSKSRRTDVENRKRSATKARRASKSGIPAQSLAVLQNGVSSRNQNVPSSAAPASFAPERRLRSPQPPQEDPPPPYQEPELPSRQSRLATARSARPSSSRPAPPRVKTASRSRLAQLTENRMAEQVAGVETAPAAQVWPPPEGLKLDLESEQDDADEYVMSSQKLQDSLLKMDTSEEDGADFGVSSGPNKGRLVQQLMETKSELEGNVGAKSKLDNNQDTVTSTDTKQLRGHVQDLCQSVGTLSKALNYLHEDVDPMMSELAKWREEYRVNLAEIVKIQSETAKDLDPLKKELETIELEVKEYSERLINAKAGVHRNAILIGKLIESV